MFFVFLSLTTHCPAQEDYDVIPWSSDLKLSWTDFKGKPTNERAAAITASGVTYRFSSEVLGDEVEIDFTVVAHFYPNKSWYNAKLVNSTILEHEQRHFDITEIFARKMRKLMATTKFTKHVRKEVKAIYKEINAQMHEFQNEYDKDTNFSRNLNGQELWNEKITALLNAY